MFSPQLLDHFEHPRNAGDVAHPDGEVQVENPACGDLMKLMLRVIDGKIAEAKYQVRGCVAAIACGSALTEALTGKSVSEAKKIKRESLVETLGGLPNESVHASHLAIDCLKLARVADLVGDRRLVALLLLDGEMGTALLAMHFDAAHAEAAILRDLDICSRHRLGEARPACSGIELRVGREQRCAASDAAIHAFLMIVPIRAGEGALGSLLASDMVLLWSELPLPLFFGLTNLVAHTRSLVTL